MRKLILIFSESPEHPTQRQELGQFNSVEQARGARESLVRKWNSEHANLVYGARYFYSFTIIENA